MAASPPYLAFVSDCLQELIEQSEITQNITYIRYMPTNVVANTLQQNRPVTEINQIPCTRLDFVAKQGSMGEQMGDITFLFYRPTIEAVLGLPDFEPKETDVIRVGVDFDLQVEEWDVDPTGLALFICCKKIGCNPDAPII